MAILPQVFTLPLIASNASVTSALEIPGVYTKMYLQVPTMTAGYTVASTPIYITVSSDPAGSAGTAPAMVRYSSPEINTFPVGSNDFTIASSVSSRMVYLGQLSTRWIQVELSANASAGAASLGQFKVIAVIE